MVFWNGRRLFKLSVVLLGVTEAGEEAAVVKVGGWEARVRGGGGGFRLGKVGVRLLSVSGDGDLWTETRFAPLGFKNRIIAPK